MSLLKALSAISMVLRTVSVTTSRWCQKTFDVRDAMLAVGLVLLAAGLWKVSQPAAMIVPGAIIIAVSIFANRINGNDAKEE